MSEWRTVPDWPEYEVSDCGEVRRVGRAKGATAGRPCNCHAGRQGERLVRLSRHGESDHVRVDVCVLSAFAGPRPRDKVPLHANGDKLDCRACNLRWATKGDAKIALLPFDHARYRCGHARTAENTYVMGGSGHCRQCHRTRYYPKPRRENGPHRKLVEPPEIARRRRLGILRAAGSGGVG